MLTIMWAFFILIASVLPGDKYPQVDLINIDKVIHFLVYAVLSFLMLKSIQLNFETTFPGEDVLFTLILCIGYGILLELVQLVIPNRNFSLIDAAFNTAGAIFGVLILKGIKWAR